MNERRERDWPMTRRAPHRRSGRDLDALVELIACRSDPSGGWRVSASEIRDELGIDPLDFYRDMYAAATAERSVLDIGDITGDFCHESPEVLLAALEVFYGAGAEPCLTRAGVFFPHASRVDILEIFITVTAAAITRHAYDTHEFSAMLRSLKGFEAARTAYLGTHFPLDGLIEEAIERYCAGRWFGIPALARANVRRLIELFFRRHVLSETALFAGLSERMYRQAADEGHVGRERPAGSSADGQAPTPPRAVALDAARRTLGVAGLPLSRRLLRDRYRGLMKRFHPDINPAGLERAKEINAAYSRLLAALL